MEIFDLLHRDGRTIIMVTHGEDIAARAGRVITIRDGYLQVSPTRAPLVRRRNSRRQD